MSNARSLDDLKDNLKASDRMPLVFLGHGSPMNAIEDTVFSRAWTALGHTLPRPQAILVVSAHWMTEGTTLVDVSDIPRTIHDFYGFPDELYAQQYPAQGHPGLAREVVTLLASHNAEEDDTWGLDHGAWALLKFLYPGADVPVFQISIDMSADLNAHLAVGKSLAQLRDRGVLILGSGNIVHNLSTMQMEADPFDWAIEFDDFFSNHLADRDFHALSNRTNMGTLLSMAHPSLDHYIPTLTVAGAAHKADELYFMTESIDLGSVSMRSFVFHGS